MADWSSPSLSSSYTNFLAELKARDDDAASLFVSAPTNQPTGAFRFNRSTNLFEEWNGSAWQVKTLAVAGGGTGATTAAGARTALGLNSMATQADSAVAITGGTVRGVEVNLSTNHLYGLATTTSPNPYLQYVTASSSWFFADDASTKLQIAASGIISIPNGPIEFTEIGDPTAPSANKGRLYVRDNGSGKSQLCIRFPTGAIQVISTEP